MISASGWADRLVVIAVPGMGPGSLGVVETESRGSPAFAGDDTGDAAGDDTGNSAGGDTGDANGGSAADRSGDRGPRAVEGRYRNAEMSIAAAS